MQTAERTRLGVLGWPVGHSRSPAIHNAALAAVGMAGWRYQLLPVDPALFDETVRALPGAGFRGANVTIPHKLRALELADHATPRARAIGAANVLLFEPGGAIHAENTDAPALIESLPFSPAGRSALVMGAGGSARAVVWALLDAGAGQVRVWNRTSERAAELASELGAVAVARAEPADLLVNCTSVGLDKTGSDFKQLPLAADDVTRYQCVVDLVYADMETALVKAARTRAIQVIDGLELLIGQAAFSFKAFTGISAPVAAMSAAVGRWQ